MSIQITMLPFPKGSQFLKNTPVRQRFLTAARMDECASKHQKPLLLSPTIPMRPAGDMGCIG